jgi:predicted metal-dependent hydrolase
MQEKSFPYTITYTRNRRAYVKISEEGNVLFMIPNRRKTDAKLLRELFEMATVMWVRYQQRPKLEKRNEEGIMLFGEWVEWEESPFDFAFSPTNIKKLEKKLKEILYEYAKERLDIFSGKLGEPYQSLTIRKAKSRWGSCSSHQKIMLSLSLIFLPRTAIQYVIAHEAAHLVEKNHSKAFWAVVGQLFPAYKEVRKSLNKTLLVEGVNQSSAF